MNHQDLDRIKEETALTIADYQSCPGCDGACSDCWDEANSILTKILPLIAHKIWDEAIQHAWKLADPACTVIEDTVSSRSILTMTDMLQALRENPYQ